jgi:putative hydrolase of the HAD superfamily
MDGTRFRDCKALLFDFGGTIDADGEHWLDRFFRLYEDAVIDVPRAEIKRAFYYADGVCRNDRRVASLGLRALIDRHVTLQFEALAFESATKQTALVDAFCRRSQAVLVGRSALFSRLRTRYRLGIVSNFYGNLGVIVGEAGLTPAFDVLLDSGRVGLRKPDPALFRLALARLELRADEVAFIGDSYPRDMGPSAAAGMRTIWLRGTYDYIPEGAPPVDGRITRLDELEVLAP